MGEPLFDGLSIAAVGSGALAILVLRSAFAEAANPDRLRRLSIIGHLWLGIAVSLIVYRWVDGVMSLPTDSRPSVWRSGALAAACGIGLVAAVKALIGLTPAHRIRSFVIAVACASAALITAAAWDWALLILAVLAIGVALAMWNSRRTASEAVPYHAAEDQPREPALVLIATAALLLLLLGTWQHVLENETQRTTRSARYSAWPRATALRNAWERTGWTAKPGDAESAIHTANVAAREQRIALGLGALLLVVATVSWRRASHETTTSESDHAG